MYVFTYTYRDAFENLDKNTNEYTDQHVFSYSYCNTYLHMDKHANEYVYPESDIDSHKLSELYTNAYINTEV